MAEETVVKGEMGEVLDSDGTVLYSEQSATDSEKGLVRRIVRMEDSVGGWKERLGEVSGPVLGETRARRRRGRRA